jgi:hypothetical protein
MEVGSFPSGSTASDSALQQHRREKTSSAILSVSGYCIILLDVASPWILMGGVLTFSLLTTLEYHGTNLAQESQSTIRPSFVLRFEEYI